MPAWLVRRCLTLETHACVVNMCLTFFLLLLASMETVTPAKESEENTTLGSDEWVSRIAGAAGCQVMFTSSYGYRQFFLLEQAAAPTRPRPAPAAADPPDRPADARAPESRLQLHFQVMAESDAHILLVPQRRSDKDGYEIVLGAGANSYSDFRRLPMTNPPTRAFNYTSGVVSGSDMRSFWLEVDWMTGLLAVGRSGEPPFLSWTDPSPVHVRYFSVCTWTDVHGIWLYGCNRSVSALSPEESTLSWFERLQQDIQAPKRRHGLHPSEVGAKIRIENILLDNDRGVISVYSTLHLEWQDSRLQWSPQKFGNLSTTMAFPKNVWVPDLRLLNPMTQLVLGPLLEQTPLQLHSSGLLHWQTAMQTSACCSISVPQWGFDSTKEIYTCQLSLIAQGPQPVNMTLLESEIKFSSQPSGSDWNWGPISARPHHIRPPWHDEGFEQPGLLLEFQVTRRNLKLNSAIIATYTAAGLLCVLCLLSPFNAEYHMLSECLLLLMVASALLTKHAALTPTIKAAGTAAVSCLSSAMVIVGCSLILPKLLVFATNHTFPRYLHNFLNNRISVLLCCQHKPCDTQQWQESPCNAEEALQILNALAVEESQRDWHTLSGTINKLCIISCTGLVFAALII